MNKVSIHKLDTEQRNSNSTFIDRMTSLEIVTLMNQEDELVALAVKKELEAISQAVDLVVDKFAQGGRIVYAGAGTSGRIAMLDAVECPPTYGLDPTRVVALLAGSGVSYQEAKEEIEDSYETGVADCKKIELNNHDVVVGLAASGRTPYVIGVLEYALELGASTIAISCTRNSYISQLSDVAIEVNCGPEVISGSTRLKAGTAQKMILNMLSTATMVRLGKVYENLMVSVDPSNEKLVERWKNIVIAATGASYDVATQYYEITKADAKLAITMLLCDCDLHQAIQYLDNNDGKIYKVLEGRNKK